VFGGRTNGLLDDAAQRLVDRLIPEALPGDNVRAVKAALDAARKQGITSFMGREGDRINFGRLCDCTA